MRSLATLLIFVLFISSACASVAQERPNILWLTVEDISPLIGAYGYDDIKTPNLDALAEEGVLYTNTYVTAPVCAVMRSALLTGMYASTVGSHNMRSDTILSPGLKTYPELMRAAGYHATNPGKTDYQGLAGKDIWNSKAADYQSRPDKNKPFLHVQNHTETHESRSSNNPGDYDIDRLSSFPPYYPDTSKARSVWASHLQAITTMDGWVGEQLAALENSSEADNTIVFFYSDHGSGMPRGKRWIYDSGLKIPLIIRVPEKWQHLIAHTAGTRTDELISTIDLAATVLTLAGAAIPENMQGRAFLGEKLTPERRYIHAHRDRMDERYELIRGVRDKRFKYIRNYEYWKPNQQFNQYPELNKWSGVMEEIRRVYSEPNPPAAIKWFFESKPVEELYDTQNDPHELLNLAKNPDYADKLAELRAESVSWRKRSRDLGVIPEHILLERRGTEGEYHYGLHNQAAIERAWDVLDSLHTLSAQDFITLMNDKDAVIRYWATTGLGNLMINDKTVRNALINALDDDHVIVKGAAARGLLLLGPSKRASETFVTLLGEEHGYNNLVMLNALELMGDRAKDAVAKSSTFVSSKSPARAGKYILWAKERLTQTHSDDSNSASQASIKQR